MEPNLNLGNCIPKIIELLCCICTVNMLGEIGTYLLPYTWILLMEMNTLVSRTLEASTAFIEVYLLI